jgi:hypothetical protein
VNPPSDIDPASLEDFQDAFRITVLRIAGIPPLGSGLTVQGIATAIRVRIEGVRRLRPTVFPEWASWAESEMLRLAGITRLDDGRLDRRPDWGSWVDGWLRDARLKELGRRSSAAELPS